MSQLKNLRQYSGVIVNFALALAFLLIHLFSTSLALQLWWVLPLLILETWAFTVKIRDTKHRFPKQEMGDDMGVLFLFIWLGHAALSTIMLMFCFVHLTDLAMMLMIPLVLREVAFLLMLFPSKVEKAPKGVFIADLVLGLFLIMSVTLIWENMIAGTPSTGLILLDIPLIALLSVLLVLPARMAFLYEEWFSIRTQADQIWWWGSLIAVIVGSVWIAL